MEINKIPVGSVSRKVVSLRKDGLLYLKLERNIKISKYEYGELMKLRIGMRIL